MNRNEYLNSINDVEINIDVKEKMEKVFGNVPEEILKILTKSPSVELFDDNESRTLALIEILNAEQDYGVPFQSNKLIPIVDKGNNDFIVYDGNTSKWAIYNIIDAVVFAQKETFEEIFLS